MLAWIGKLTVRASTGYSHSSCWLPWQQWAIFEALDCLDLGSSSSSSCSSCPQSKTFDLRRKSDSNLNSIDWFAKESFQIKLIASLFLWLMMMKIIILWSTFNCIQDSWPSSLLMGLAWHCKCNNCVSNNNETFHLRSLAHLKSQRDQLTTISELDKTDIDWHESCCQLGWRKNWQKNLLGPISPVFLILLGSSPLIASLSF